MLAGRHLQSSSSLVLVQVGLLTTQEHVSHGFVLASLESLYRQEISVPLWFPCHNAKLTLKGKMFPNIQPELPKLPLIILSTQKTSAPWYTCNSSKTCGQVLVSSSLDRTSSGPSVFTGYGLWDLHAFLNSSWDHKIAFINPLQLFQRGMEGNCIKDGKQTFLYFVTQMCTLQIFYRN